MTLDSVKPYAKAIVAFVTPGIIALQAAVQDASPGGSAITGPEWIGIGAACILTGGAVFAVPNKDPKAEHQDESVQPPVEAADESYPAIPDPAELEAADVPAGDSKADAAYHDGTQ